jgi:hypothetical protein
MNALLKSRKAAPTAHQLLLKRRAQLYTEMLAAGAEAGGGGGGGGGGGAGGGGSANDEIAVPGAPFLLPLLEHLCVWCGGYAGGDESISFVRGKWRCWRWSW